MKLHRLLPLALSACALGTPAGSTEDAAGSLPTDARVTVPPDGPPGTEPDAEPPVPPDAEPPAAAPSPLLLTEVSLAPTAGEFIELANPTTDTVSLSKYYLSDNGNYFRLPAGTSAVGSSDFVAHFPTGATIAPGGVVVVALDTAAAFHTATGGTADFSIADGTMITVDGSAATLTNTGELVSLFFWDGTADLVTDVDLLLAGTPTSSNGLVHKGAVAIDGPDANATTSAYPTEADTLPVQSAAPPSAMSTKRILLPTGHENAADQTSEDTQTTWDASFTAPTPGTTTLSL